MNRARDYNAVISGRRDLHDGLFFLWVKPDSGEVPAFVPGQYIHIGRFDQADGLVERSYSIGSSADKRDHVELFIVHVDDGQFTSWLGDQPVGSRIWLGPKAAGGFTLEGIRPGKDLVLVATGTGIAPYLSMYRTHRDNPPWRRIVVVNGVRYAADLGYRAELEDVARRDERFVYLPLVTREPIDSGWGGLRGRVQSVLEPDTYERLVGAPLDPAESHVFLCGNPTMVDDLETLLTGRGFARHTPGHPGTLHLEKYW